MAKLYFYYSTMNAGKSTALLQASHNYEERGMRTLLYTAQIDSRDGGRIHSRIGIEREALHFYPGLDMRAQIVTPLFREDTLAAVLSVHSLKELRSWSGEETALARSAARLLGLLVGATLGDVGVNTASTVENAFAHSRRISLRTRSACR